MIKKNFILVSRVLLFLALFNGLVTKFEIPGSPDSPFAYFFMNVPKLGWARLRRFLSFI